MHPKYQNRLIGTVEAKGGHDIFVHEGNAFHLAGYRLLDADAKDPVAAAIKEAERELNGPIKEMAPFRGYILGHHYLLVIDRESAPEVTVWCYSKSNGHW